MRPPLYWIKALVQNPRLAKWYSHWENSLNGKRSPLSDELPWVTYGAIDWFSLHLNKGMVLFEWGSGGSTAFFSRHVEKVFTVEHNPIWYQEVVSTITKNVYDNVKIDLVTPEKADRFDNWYLSTDSQYKGFSFEKYARTIDLYPNHFFDVVFIDGRARPGCIRQSLLKIKSGGYLILDNSERKEYSLGLNLVPRTKDVKIFGPGPYNGIPWETRIMRFPN